MIHIIDEILAKPNRATVQLSIFVHAIQNIAHKIMQLS